MSGQAALRFSLEHDASEWRDRLHLYYLEMCDLPSVELFCDQFLADDSVVRHNHLTRFVGRVRPGLSLEQT